MDNLETITLAGGCFWCIEAFFTELKGVVSTVSGFSGGSVENPTYLQVHIQKNTGHAEAIQIKFNPNEITLEKILDVFWHIHNPTTLNRDGANVGPEYRSVIFYNNDKQKEIAEASKKRIEDEKAWDDPIVTEIVPYKNFYPAEDWNQNFYANNPEQPYCQIVIDPKIKKFRQQYAKELK